jgi:hypothetical protein
MQWHFEQMLSEQKSSRQIEPFDGVILNLKRRPLKALLFNVLQRFQLGRCPNGSEPFGRKPFGRTTFRRQNVSRLFPLVVTIITVFELRRPNVCRENGFRAIGVAPSLIGNNGTPTNLQNVMVNVLFAEMRKSFLV